MGVGRGGPPSSLCQLQSQEANGRYIRHGALDELRYWGQSNNRELHSNWLRHRPQSLSPAHQTAHSTSPGPMGGHQGGAEASEAPPLCPFLLLPIFRKLPRLTGTQTRMLSLSAEGTPYMASIPFKDRRYFSVWTPHGSSVQARTFFANS